MFQDFGASMSYKLLTHDTITLKYHHYAWRVKQVLKMKSLAA